MSLAAAVSVPVGDLLIGSTILLGSGTLAAALAVAPVHRQRAAELSVAATLVWLALALVPLSRWPRSLEDRSSSERSAAPVSAAAAAPFDAAPAAVPGVPTASAVDGSATAPAHGEPTGVMASDAAGPAALRSSWTWPRRLGAAYAAGSVLAVAYVGLGLLLVRGLLSRSVPPPPWLAAVFEERCRALGVRRARLRLTAGRCRPLAAGVLRPTVVLPCVLADPARVAAIRQVLDHELVHVRRGDALGRVLFAAAAPLLWVHPLFWWLRARAGLAAELIADDGAAGETGRRAYARGLLALAEEVQSLRPAPGIVPGTFRNRSELARRIEMLIQPNGRLATTCTPKRRAVQAAATLLAVTACTAAFGARSLPAEESGPRTAVGGGDVATERVAAARAVTAHDAGSRVPSADRDAPLRVEDVGTSVARSSGLENAPEDAGRPAAAGDRERVVAQPDAAPLDLTTSRQEPDPGYAATLALVDRALTLRNELELAKAQLGIERIRVREMVNDRELTMAALTLQGLERRLEVVLILVQSEIQATQIELAQLERATRLGHAGPSADALRVRLAARLQVLQSVL